MYADNSLDSSGRYEWIDGIHSEMRVFGYAAIPDNENKSTANVRRFTYVLNVLSYVLGPVIGIIRLIAALIFYIQADNYSRVMDTERVSITLINQHVISNPSEIKQNEARRFSRRMARRGLLELFGCTLFPIGPVLDIAFSCKDNADFSRGHNPSMIEKFI